MMTLSLGAGAVAPIEHLSNSLPRSITRPNTYTLLDGSWHFAPDLENRGLEQQWYLGREWFHTVQWPQSIEEHIATARGTQLQEHPEQDTVVAWYEREFELPDQCCQTADILPQLTFGACGYETRVWLNGYLLRTIDGEDTHLGRWTSFSYELPSDLLRPTNRLTVRIADSLDPETPRGKQESRVFKRGGIWYQTHTGAVGSVWVETVERNRLRSRLDVVSSIKDGLVEFGLTVRIHDRDLYTIRLTVSSHTTGEAQCTEEYQLPLDGGDHHQWFPLELAEAQPWSPERPNLYHVEAILSSPAGVMSRIHGHFGIRKIEARDRSIYLNNEQLYLDGVLYQPGTASLAQMRSHLHAMKELGCNLVRVHIAGIDPRIYDMADEIGMLLWVEVPSPHTSTDCSRENHWAELMRMLPLISSHPSIALLSLYNEDWGAQDIASSPATREYMTKLSDYLRLHYPQLLVIDNDGWHHVSTEGILQSDLLTAHIYTPDLEQWQGALDGLVEGRTGGVTVQPLVLGDPFFYQGQVPLVVSEWGGFGWSGYGGPEEGNAKAERIRAFKDELRRRPVAGDVYTQAVSIEGETNGLIDPLTGVLQLPPGILGSTQYGAAAPPTNG